MTQTSDFAKRLATAIADHASLPEFHGELELDAAYALQHQVTDARTQGKVGGLKAGVTSPAPQKFLNVDHALIASLYADSRFGQDCELPYLEGRGIESEVAVTIDGQGNPISIAPAIEIVYLKFARQTDMTAANLVACNLGADLYIVGEPQPWEPKFKDTEVALSRDGDLLNSAEMAEAIEGPENASQWMWLEASKRGFPLGNETLLLTGACGSVVPAEIGNYRADYGDLGTLNFSIVATD